MHHNGCACASCRPVVIEKEIAQLKKKKKKKKRRRRSGGPQKSNLAPRYCRRVLCVISALFSVPPNGANRDYQRVKNTANPIPAGQI